MEIPVARHRGDDARGQRNHADAVVIVIADIEVRRFGVQPEAFGLIQLRQNGRPAVAALPSPSREEPATVVMLYDCALTLACANRKMEKARVVFILDGNSASNYTPFPG